MEVINTNGIHCKLACDGQFRRFLYNGTEFAPLYRQVKALLSLSGEKEFVLKYEDEEGDLITIGSDEELACAVGCGKDPVLLRLTAVVANSKGEKVEKLVECDFSDDSDDCKGKKWKCKRGGRGRRCGHPYGREILQHEFKGDVDDNDCGYAGGRGHHGGRGRGRGYHGFGRGRGCHGEHCFGPELCKREDKCEKRDKKDKCEKRDKKDKCEKGDKMDKKCEKRGKMALIHLQKKKERLESSLLCLEKTPQEEGNYLMRQKRIAHLKDKIAFIDMKLNALQRADPRRELTEEEKKQAAVLRERIKTIKYIIRETKAQLKMKKKAAKGGQQSSGEGAAFEAEVNEMKVTIWDLKKQVRELKSQLYLVAHFASAMELSPTPTTPAATQAVKMT